MCAQLLGHLVWQVLPELLEPLVPAQKAAGPLSHRRVVLEVGEHVVTQRAVGGEERRRVEHGRVDGVGQHHDLADHRLGFLDARVVDIFPGKDDRQPLRRRDHLGGADNRKEKALQLVVGERAGRSGRMLEECAEGAGVRRGQHQLRGYRRSGAVSSGTRSRCLRGTATRAAMQLSGTGIEHAPT